MLVVVKKIVEYIYKMRRISFWAIGILFLIFSLFYAGMYFLCKYKGDTVVDVVQHSLDDATSLTWKISGGIRPTFSPFLGFMFSHIAVYDEDTSSSNQDRPLFKAKNLRVEPNMLALLVGRLGVDSITLIDPEVVITQKKAVPILKSSPSEKNAKEKTSLVTSNSSLAINSTPLDLKRDEGKRRPFINNSTYSSGKTQSTSVILSSQGEVAQKEQLSDTDLLILVRNIIQSSDRERIGHLKVVNGHFSLHDEKGGVVASLEDISLSFFSSLGKKNTFAAKGTIPSADICMDINAFFSFPKDIENFVLQGRVVSNISLTPPNSREIRIGMSSSINWRSDGNLISMPNLRIISEGDIVHADVLFDSKSKSARGHLQVKSLNLPRWFMFARNFPPGLQQPLLSLKGTGDFEITETSASAENLRLAFDKGLISGSVKTEDFSKPVVVVDLDLKPKDGGPLDLDYIFPFLSTYEKNVPEVVAPKFTMPFLVPYPSEGTDELPDVGYDVKVRLPNAIIHSLQGGPLKVHVFPTKGDITRVLFSSPSLAEGSASGRIDFGSTLVTMRYDLKNVNLALMPENKENSVIFAGRVTGGTDLSIKVNKGKWASSWGIIFDATAENLKISSPKEGWYLSAKKTKGFGKGVVDTIRKNGLKLDGLWNAETQGVFTSWNPKGRDTITGALKGVLAWAPSGQKIRGLNHIYGDLTADGVLIAPLASLLVPVRGKLASPFDWYIDTGKVKMDSFNFTGWQSTIAGRLQIDSGKSPALITGNYKVKASPQAILKDWNLLPDAIKMPTVVTGTGTLKSKGDVTYFGDLLLGMDGFPLSGKINTKTLTTAKSGTAEYRVLIQPDFLVEQIDFDKYLVPSTPEELKLKPATTPWDFSFMQGIDIDGKFLLKKSRLRDANFFDTNIEIKLENKKLSVLSLTSDLYGGRGTLNLQGTLDPKTSQVAIDKSLLVVKNVSLGKAFQDLQGENIYGGTASMVLDLKGLMGCTADFPAALSGDWSIEVRDGLYPAFAGSETAGLRNTFTAATASGIMEKGRMKTDNFALSGAMVDMKGGGWIDLAKQELDLNIMVNLAGVPTAPVVFKGAFSSMEMIVSGTRVVFGAAQAAGVSVFYFFKGILELPARAVRGVGSLFESKKEITGTTYEPKESVQ